MYDADQAWKQVKDSEYDEQTYNDILGSCSSWDLPEEYARIVRVYNLNTLQVTEKAFTDATKAKRFAEKNMNAGHEVTHYDAYTLYSNILVGDEA